MPAKLGKARFHWKYVRLPLELSCLLGMHRFLQFSWSLELFEASSGLWGFPTAASLNAGEMDSREFEGIRGDSRGLGGKAWAHAPLAQTSPVSRETAPKISLQTPSLRPKEARFRGRRLANVSTSAFAGTSSPPCLRLASKQAPLDCEHLQTAQLGSACHHEKL